VAIEKPKLASGGSHLRMNSRQSSKFRSACLKNERSPSAESPSRRETLLDLRQIAKSLNERGDESSSFNV
jgi:hypothetical protein